jgi:hypothetical protein
MRREIITESQFFFISQKVLKNYNSSAIYAQFSGVIGKLGVQHRYVLKENITFLLLEFWWDK